MFFASTYAKVHGLTSGPPLHDPVAVAVLVELPDRLEFNDSNGERWHVNVITDGMHSDSDEERGQVGRTDITKAGLGEGGVRIPRSLNVKRFWEVVEECIRRAESKT